MSGTLRRGLLLPSLLTAAGVGVLGLLGFWQIERMAEKRAFIERLEREAVSTPRGVPPAATWPGLDVAAIELRRIVASGRWAEGPVAGVRTTIASGGPGTRQLSGFGRWMFQGFVLAEGGTILVNRGFVPESRLAEVVPLTGEASVTGFLRAPETRNSFTPADVPAAREFFTRDPAGIAAALGLPAAPFYLEAERRGDGMVPPAGVDAGELIARIPDNHLQYALTWFGLAVVMLGVFGAYAWQGRRGG